MKVALLTRGDTELSWSIIRIIQSNTSLESLVIATQNIPSPNERFISRIFLKIRLFIRGKIFRENHPPPISPPRNMSYVYSPDINSAEALDSLTSFEPDLLIISGTKIIKDSLLSTAKTSINVHHGFLPSYRGVSSLEWVILENNYNYFCVMVHEAVSLLDAGRVISNAYVTPYFLEPLSYFKRRLFLAGAILVDEIISQWPNISYIDQSDTRLVRTFKHKNKSTRQLNLVNCSYYSKNLHRYTFLQRYRGVLNNIDQVRAPKKAVAKFIIKKLTKSSLSPGLYILTYHDVCTDHVAQYLHKTNSPSIYIGATNFFQQLEFLANEFECVTLENGLEQWKSGEAFSKRYVAITFDDGLTGVKPYLEKLSEYSLGPTLFLCSQAVVEERPLQVHKDLLLHQYRCVTGDRDSPIDEEYSVMDSERFNSSTTFRNFVKSKYFDIETINLALGESLVDSLGSHTRSHLSLSKVNYEDQLKAIVISHNVLKDRFGEKLRYYSYPFGKLDRYTFESEYLANTISTDVFQCNGGINRTPNIPGGILRIGVPDGNVDMLKQLLSLQWER